MNAFVRAVLLVGVLAGCGPGQVIIEGDEEQKQSNSELRVLTASEVLGDLALGSARTALHEGTPTYRAWRFTVPGRTTLDLKVHSDVGDAKAWLLGSSFATLAVNDDDVPGLPDARIVHTVSAGGTYYVAFREKSSRPATFAVSVDAVGSLAPPVDAGTPAKIVINEVLYDSAGTDTASGNGLFVELWGPPGQSLDGYQLLGVDGSGAEYNLIDLTGKAIGSDGYFLVAHSSGAVALTTVADLLNAKVDFQNGPDSVLLRWHTRTVDAVGYGSFATTVFKGEGGAAPAAAAGKSLSRDSNHTDTDDNLADFKVGDPSPRPAAPVCSPLCSTAGATQCAGTDALLLQICGDSNGDGCLDWSTPINCPSGQTCHNGACSVMCTNQCSSAGATKCGGTSGEQLQTCVDTNGDGCLEWGTAYSCPSGLACSLGACVSPPPPPVVRGTALWARSVGPDVRSIRAFPSGAAVLKRYSIGLNQAEAQVVFVPANGGTHQATVLPAPTNELGHISMERTNSGLKLVGTIGFGNARRWFKSSFAPPATFQSFTTMGTLAIVPANSMQLAVSTYGEVAAFTGYGLMQRWSDTGAVLQEELADVGDMEWDTYSIGPDGTIAAANAYYSNGTKTVMVMRPYSPLFRIELPLFVMQVKVLDDRLVVVTYARGADRTVVHLRDLNGRALTAAEAVGMTGHSVAVAPNGDLLLAGSTPGALSNYRPVVRRLRADGSGQVWEYKPPEVAGVEVASSVDVGTDGSVYAVLGPGLQTGANNMLVRLAP